MSTPWKYERIRILHKRVLALIGIFTLLISILVIRLFYLQIIEGNKYRQLAEKNRTSLRLTLPTRGIIYDRNGVRLAENNKKFQAVLIREETKNYRKTLDNFRRLISLDDEEFYRIEKEMKRKRAFMPIRIKDNLTFNEAALVQMNASDLIGIHIEEETTRLYPFKEDVSHVVGYVSLLTEKDMEKDPNNPLLDLPGYRIGRIGIEEAFQSRLKGKPGMRKTEINAYGRSVRVMEEEKSQKGHNLTLTIDTRLQKFATERMGDEAGAVVVLDVHTGEILTMVSTPSFDSNVFTMPISTKVWKSIINNEKKPLQNKAINGMYSPGSIFKLVVALAGLESGHITPHRKIFCSGRLQLGNQYFHCWKRYGHAHLTIEEALMHSCDIYFYQVAQEIGAEKILEVAQRLGFGEETHTFLTGEKSGLLPSAEWKKARYKDDWRMGDTLNLSIGQGFLMATPLQMARAVAQIANGGKKLRITLLKDDHIKSTTMDLGFNKRHIQIIKNGMNMVVNKKGGTAHKVRFDINGQKMAGKTASTQVRRISMKERHLGVISQEQLPWKYRDHGMFGAFAPISNPRYAIVVVVEHGGGGSISAAPIASDILQEVLRLYPTENIIGRDK